MPTVSTIPVLILFLFLWRATKGQILSCVLFFSVFSAMAVFAFGELGIAPWQFALGAGLFLKVLKGHGRYRFAPGLNKAALHLGLIFIAYGIWSGLVYPVIFRGVMIVRMAPRLEPLQWNMGNFAQLCYLVACAVIYLLAVSCTRKEMSEAIDWYVRACVLAAIIAMYQLLNATLHIPYPDALFYSNPGHVIYHAYKINGMWRLNSTFNEASEMSGFLVVALCLLGWRLATEKLKISRMLAFLVTLISVVMTLSSVGYACTALMFVLGLLLMAHKTFRARGLSPIRVILGLILVSGTITLVTLNDAVAPWAVKVVRATLIDKKESSSFKDRSSTHADAITTLEATYYVGAGWGSVRASGMGYTVLANMGVLGIVLYGLFNAALFFPLLHSPPKGSDPPDPLLAKSLFAIAVFTLAMLAAGSSPIDPILWALVGAATLGRGPSARPVHSWQMTAGAQMHAA